MRPCKRRCWECGNVADHDDVIHPYVNCKKCGSQDTRLVKAASTTPPARDWKPVTGEDVWVKATVIRLRPEREGYVDVEIADHYYYADSGEVSDLEDPERVRLPLSSIRPMTGRDGGK